jgi:hypothetical protein
MAEPMSCSAKPGGYCARRHLVQYAGHIESCALVGQHGEGCRWVRHAAKAAKRAV